MESIKDLISIVIPVYKVEAYLKKSMESILNQTYKKIEIILVDDGSPDNCGRICDEYAQKDKRIKVFHTKNQGVSAARNYGLKKATGEYIIFIDSDDILDTSMIRKLYDNIIKYNADISTCGYLIIELKGKEYLRYGTGKIYEFNRNQALESYFSETSFGVGVWNKLFRKKIISKLNFREDLKINEDRFFLFEALMESEKIIYEDLCLYKYIKRENSATTSKFSKKQFDVLKVNNLIRENLKEKINDNGIRKLCEISELIYLVRLYRILSMSKAIIKYKNQKNEIIKRMKDIVKNNDISNINIFEKIETILIVKVNILYYPIMRILLKLKFIKEIKSRMQRKRNENENSDINNTR